MMDGKLRLRLCDTRINLKYRHVEFYERHKDVAGMTLHPSQFFFQPQSSESPFLIVGCLLHYAHRH